MNTDNPTTQNTAATGGTDSQPTRLKRTLGTWSLILFGVTYLAPVTVFTTYGIVADMTDNHLPASYVVALVAMIFTALSYAAISRQFPMAGSAYAYTQRAFGRHIGFMTGWTLMLDYLFLPMINFLLMGIYLNTQFPSIPAWVFSLVGVIVVTILNVVGIKLVDKVNFVIVSLAIVLMVVFVALCLKTLLTDPVVPAPGILDPFLPGSGTLGPIFAGAGVLCLSFLGFDAVSTMSEEAKDPRRSVPRAIIGTTLVGGAIFIVVSWVGALVFPDIENFSNLDSASVDLMLRVGGAIFPPFFVAIYVAGCFGSAMTSEVSITRILYAMGRDGVFPKKLAQLHPKFATPVIAIAVVSIACLLSLVLDLALVSTLISFGALFAFSLVNLSVIGYFLIRNKNTSGKGIIRYGVLPLIGFICTVWLWTSLTATTFIVGLSWMAVGLIYLVVLTQGFKRQPPMMDFSEEESHDREPATIE